MKFGSILVIGTMLLISCNRNSLSPADMIAQAISIDKQTIISFNAGEQGDLEGYLSNFWNSPELTIADVGKMLIGFDAWKSEITAQLKERGANRFTYTKSENIVQGSYVVGYGRYKYVMEKTGAPPKIFEGLYTDVKAIRDGKMVIITAHYSRVNKPE